MTRSMFACTFLAFIVASQAAELFHIRSSAGRYRFTYWQARRACINVGASLATRDELEEARKAGYSLCNCGWTMDKSAAYPMTTASKSCGGKAALNSCDWQKTWDAFCYRGDSIGNCSAPLGVESGEIRDSQMVSTSEFNSWYLLFTNSRWRAGEARLHNKDLVNAWVPYSNARRLQYLEVDLERPTAVTGIVTQGASKLGEKMWVISYTIQYSKDGYNYKSIQEDGKDKIFIGNTNNNGLVRNMFPEAILTRHIRILPFDWHNHIALRIELFGCDMEIYELSKQMARDVVVQNIGGEKAIGDTVEREPEK